MADRFWVGNGGNINDTAHWSTTSGGAGGASAPTSADNAYFDALSFTSTGQTVTLNVASSCLDMNWTGATNSPTLAMTSAFNIYGSLTFIAGMSVSGAGNVNFAATTTARNVITAGKIIGGNIDFLGVGGGWVVQDSLTTLKTIYLSNGALDTNGKTVSCLDFNLSNANVRTLTLGASVISLSGNWTATTVTNLTFNKGTSTINLSTVGAASFTGGGLTYYNVNLLTSPITINGSNGYNILTLTAGKTINIAAGTTQTPATLICNGTVANPITLQTNTAGSAATIALPAGRYFVRHTSIKDITVTGATSLTSIAGTNVSGNTGITFVTKFEMGRIKNDGSFNWYNTSTGVVTKISG
jgi:hypothetical protein